MMGALCGIAVLGGCGGDGEPVTPEPPRASAISVSPESAMLSSLGETVTFTATITDQYGAVFDGSVAWSSSDPGVAEVALSGRVTATGNGAATVTATHVSLTAGASVVVAQQAGRSHWCRAEARRALPAGSFRNPSRWVSWTPGAPPLRASP